MSGSNLPRYISFAQLREVYGIARSTAYRYIADNGMPKPLQFGANSVRFDKEEIEQWFATRPRARAHVNNEEAAA